MNISHEISGDFDLCFGIKKGNLKNVQLLKKTVAKFLLSLLIINPMFHLRRNQVVGIY